MSSSASNSEPAYLGNVIVVAITVVVIVEGEINHLLWTGQDLLEEGKASSSKLNSSPSEASVVQVDETSWPKAGSA
jgi:hypothetical protein